MNKKKLEKLVKELNMQHELYPLLDSNQDYIRLEETLNTILDKIGSNAPVIWVRKYRNIRIGGGGGIYGLYGGTPAVREYKKILYSRLKSIQNFPLAACQFKKYYGIGIEPQDIKDIATDYGRSINTTSSKINFVVNVLKQNYKSDIWYGTL